jgi:hypothetical protein
MPLYIAWEEPHHKFYYCFIYFVFFHTTALSVRLPKASLMRGLLLSQYCVGSVFLSAFGEAQGITYQTTAPLPVIIFQTLPNNSVSGQSGL